MYESIVQQPDWHLLAVAIAAALGGYLTITAMMARASGGVRGTTGFRHSRRTGGADFADLAVEGLLISDGTVAVSANDSFLKLYGGTKSDIVDRPLGDFVSQDDRAKLAEGATGPTIETEFADRSGTSIPVELAQREADYRGVPHLVIAFRDLRARQEAQDKIRFLAFNDPLTELSNRESFIRQLDRAMSRQKGREGSIALLALDLDNFKAVNDTMGHPVGDQLLCLMAERILSACRPEDCVSRFGGDEFAVFLRSDKQPEAAESLSGRLIELLSRPAIIDGQIVSVGTSVGIAIHGRDGTTVKELMKSADVALYRAKEEGRGTFVFFENEMDLAMRERRALENDLRTALARSELQLVYQPVIEARSNSIKGFEALLRWTHPERGAIEPAEFVPLAEKNGLMVQIGEWVLHKACREASGWPNDLSVAVNLSAAHFCSNRLLHAVSEALDNSGLAPNRLELELTESALMSDSAPVFEILAELRELGVKIVMDDFGTGYSSLSCLRAFPFDSVKIDRAFVEEMGSDANSEAIVKAIIGLGRSLGIATTAEGVETADQRARIEAEGCDFMQGHYFSRPVPGEQVPKLIEGQEVRVA